MTPYFKGGTPMADRKAREYRVRLYADENDDYNELWISKEGKFFLRHTACPGGIWCILKPVKNERRNCNDTTK